MMTRPGTGVASGFALGAIEFRPRGQKISESVPGLRRALFFSTKEKSMSRTSLRSIDLTGYLRRDQFGRLFIDECQTDEEHLTLPLPEGQERRTCRDYIDDIIPEEYVGKQVEFCLDFRIISKER